MLRVFYIDIAKVDLGVAHVAVGPICAWVWRGAPRCGRGTGAARATVRVRDKEHACGQGVGMGHGATQTPT